MIKKYLLVILLIIFSSLTIVFIIGKFISVDIAFLLLLFLTFISLFLFPFIVARLIGNSNNIYINKMDNIFIPLLKEKRFDEAYACLKENEKYIVATYHKLRSESLYSAYPKIKKIKDNYYHLYFIESRNYIAALEYIKRLPPYVQQHRAIDKFLLLIVLGDLEAGSNMFRVVMNNNNNNNEIRFSRAFTIYSLVYGNTYNDNISNPSIIEQDIINKYINKLNTKV